MLFFQPFFTCYSRIDLWRGSRMGSMETQAILVTANTNSIHMLNHLPGKIALALAGTPCRSVYWKNRKGKPLQRVSAPGWTSVGQMLKTDPEHPAARRTHTRLLRHRNAGWWNSRAICCLLSREWNKTGERFCSSFVLENLPVRGGMLRRRQIGPAASHTHTTACTGSRTQSANTLKSQINISKIGCAPGETRGLPTRRIKKLISA